MSDATRPPIETNGAAPHFYKRRPIHLCTDDRENDDEGPPNWTPKMDSETRRSE